MPRVVGQSTRPLTTRLTEHKSHGLNGRYITQNEIDWIRALDQQGLKPFIMCLEEVEVGRLDEREKYWIKYGRELGWRLLNESTGGGGRPGTSRPHKTETEQKILPIYKDEQKEKDEAS